MAKTDVIFYRTDNGTEPVRSWLQGLPKEEKQAIGGAILNIQYKWPDIGKPKVEMIDGIYCARINHKGNQFRIFFVYIKPNIILIHGFFKKTEETPDKEKKIANERLKHLG